MLGVTYKTAWFMSHRIREGVKPASPAPLGGAATADGLKQIILNYYGNTGSTAPVVFAAAIATVVISPLQERIQRWSEQRFQRNLVMLRCHCCPATGSGVRLFA